MPIQFLPSPDGFEKPMNFQVRLMDLSWRTFLYALLSARQGAGGNQMLEIKNLTIQLDREDRYLVKDMNLSLAAGEKAVLAGEEGNGKSTLLKAILHQADWCTVTGEIRLDGLVGYLPQISAVEGTLAALFGSVANNWKNWIQLFHLRLWRSQHPAPDASSVPGPAPECIEPDSDFKSPPTRPERNILWRFSPPCGSLLSVVKRGRVLFLQSCRQHRDEH